MAYNKVEGEDGTVYVDMTDATATADDIVEGATAYGADGTKMTGTLRSLGTGDVFTQDTDGLVPAPQEYSTTKYLRADGRWATPDGSGTGGGGGGTVLSASVRRTSDGAVITIVDKDGPTEVQIYDGAKGEAFTFEDFTPEQLESLRGEDGTDAEVTAEKVLEVLGTGADDGTFLAHDGGWAKPVTVEDVAVNFMGTTGTELELTKSGLASIRATDTPIVSINTAGLTADGYKAQLREMAKVYRIETLEGAVKAYLSAPLTSGVTLRLILKVVR